MRSQRRLSERLVLRDDRFAVSPGWGSAICVDAAADPSLIPRARLRRASRSMAAVELPAICFFISAPCLSGEAAAQLLAVRAPLLHSTCHRRAPTGRSSSPRLLVRQLLSLEYGDDSGRGRRRTRVAVRDGYRSPKIPR